MILTEKQKQTFTEKGFIVLKGFFNKQEITRISDWVDDLRDKQPRENEEAKYYEKSIMGDDSILVRIENVFGDHNAEITDLVISSRTSQHLTELLGEQPVLFKDKVNFKLPGCRADKLHQDQAAGWNAYGDFYISMGIVVDENRKDNAALSFMNSGNYERALMTEEWQPLSTEDPPYQPEDEYVLLEADPGDVIFFDSYVPHGSPANTSSRSRRNIFITFNAASQGDKRERYYADKWKNYPGIDPDHARENKSFRV
jgi:ectoine hydroxylase-related dioxygenase (phytanoyl-CoA dioxygenase family)